MTDGERQAALEQIANEVRVCTRCRLHQQRTRSVPGEGNADTEVVFVGEGPGFNEDREGRPFVGRAGALLVRLLASVGWRREDVFITNVVKCRPPENRDPMPDEIAACAPFLRRQLQVLDPALVVTLGRFSMATFMPDARISQAHGTMRPVDPATGAADAIAFAMYHPAAALRSTDIEQASFRDMAGVPMALLKARERREQHAAESATRHPVAPAEDVAGAEALAPAEDVAGAEALAPADDVAPAVALATADEVGLADDVAPAVALAPASDVPAAYRPAADGPVADASCATPAARAADAVSAPSPAHPVPASLADAEPPIDQLTLF